MDKNLEPYVEIKDDNITFAGNNEEERKLNQWLFHTTLELNRYQDMTAELLKYALTHRDIPEVNHILELVKEWGC